MYCVYVYVECVCVYVCEVKTNMEMRSNPLAQHWFYWPSWQKDIGLKIWSENALWRKMNIFLYPAPSKNMVWTTCLGGVMKKSKKWNWLLWDNLWLVPPDRHSPFTWKMNPLDSGSKWSCKPSVSFFSPFYKMEGQTMGGGLVMKWYFSQHISVASFLQPKADANWWWLPSRPLFKGLLFLIGTKLKYKFKRGCRRSLGCVQENKIEKN